MGQDPNRDRNDPMTPEFWLLAEDLQDKIRTAGYDSPTVEGIAVDIHDLLQASKRIESDLAPTIVGEQDRARMLAALVELKFEFEHIQWHCQAAVEYLDIALKALAVHD